MVHAFEHASGRPVPIQFAPRRPGDIDATYADVSLAQEMLGWQATRDLAAMCADSWRWQQMNPNGLAG
jgi:UDP-glucose 4-epimerase